MIARGLDRDLKQYLTSNRCLYSRYADDITISTDMKQFPDTVVSIQQNTIVLSSKIIEIIAKNGFTINNSKTGLSDMTQRHEVTGLTINSKMNVNREYIIELRSILYNCKNNGIYYEARKYIAKYPYKVSSRIRNNIANEDIIIDWFNQVLIGKLNFLKMVKSISNPSFVKLAKQYNALVGHTIFDIDRYYNEYQWIEKNLFVLENEVDIEQGTGLHIGNGKILTCKHVFRTSKDCSIFNSKQISDIYHAKIEWESDTFDLAILSVDGFDCKDTCPTLIKSNIESGKKIYVAGFPNYNYGSTMHWQEGKVIGSTPWLGNVVYHIDAKIISGMSGGPVLDENFNVIGVIKQGNLSMAEASINDDKSYGFVALNDLPNNYFI